MRRWLVLILFVLFAYGCVVNPVTGRRELALMQVSENEEITMGEKTFPTAVQQLGGEYPDVALSDYVSGVGVKLGRQSERPNLPWSFRVVNDSTPNAFALPGGYIAITRGLLVHLENEAQLAAVLGHEIGHVTARHAVQGIQRGTLLNAALAVLSQAAGETGYGPLAQQVGSLTASLLEKAYSREQERESDRLGIDYMVKAGYDPQGAVQLQEFFYRQMEGGTEPGWVTGLFRTHPFSKERMDANRAYIAERYGSSHFQGLRADPFQKAVEKLRSTEKGYELYDRARKLEGEGDTSGAIALYLDAAAAAPDESLILTGLGMAYLRSDDLNSARIHLSKAVKLDDKYYLSRMGLGYVYLQHGKPATGVSHLEASMKLLPTLQGGYLLAEGYEKTGENEKALELYKAVAQADSGGKLGRSAEERIKALGGR